MVPTGLYANKKVPEEQKRFEKAYRDLRIQLIKMGMFDASPLYYTWKVTSNLLILAASVYCAITTDSWAWNMAGAVLLALPWQQCGWLAHDFLHHQVFKARWKGDLAGVVIGDLFQGFSSGGSSSTMLTTLCPTFTPLLLRPLMVIPILIPCLCWRGP